MIGVKGFHDATGRGRVITLAINVMRGLTVVGAFYQKSGFSGASLNIS
jgi:hypothetical protein